jgi:hypothetical protein
MQRDKDLPEVIVTPNSYKKYNPQPQRFGGFHWPSATKDEIQTYREEKYRYERRWANGEKTIQGRESKTYLDNIDNFERRRQTEADGRKMALGAVVLMASPVAVMIYPEIQAAYTGLAAISTESGIVTNYAVNQLANTVKNSLVSTVVRYVPLTLPAPMKMNKLFNTYVTVSAKDLFGGVAKVFTTAEAVKSESLPSNTTLFPTVKDK